MGCDIHCFAEKRNEVGVFKILKSVEPFDVRSYRLFGFLAGVRNYSAITPIALPRGIPEDASAWVAEEHESWSCDAHSASWLSVAELLAFDYEAECEDRRCTRRMPGGCISGGETRDPGQGVKQSYREFLGQSFFDDLEALKQEGAERVIFWFDS